MDDEDFARIVDHVDKDNNVRKILMFHWMCNNNNKISTKLAHQRVQLFIIDVRI